ncbi:MAG: RidA family protein [Proteobacteria bacterium]|nr:RidA family protein [Pseudomonadota bacterium]
MDFDAKLTELFIEMQEPPSDKGSVQAAAQIGKTLIVGQALPYSSGRLHHQGRVGIEVKTDAAKLAARTAAVMALSCARRELGGSLAGVKRVVSIEAFVACGADFKDHDRVIDGASDLMGQIFGPYGKHVRSAAGVASLPQNACLSLSVTFELK